MAREKTAGPQASRTSPENFCPRSKLGSGTLVAGSGHFSGHQQEVKGKQTIL